MKVNYLVATNHNYVENTVPHMNIPETKDYKFDYVVNDFGVEICFLKLIPTNDSIHYVIDNSFEYSALIHFVNNPEEFECDYVFLLQDTCKLGEKFFEKTLNFSNKHDVIDVYKGRSSMAMYKKEFLLDNKNYINSFLNCTKKRSIEEEGNLVKKAKNLGVYPAETPYKRLGFEKVYDGVERLVEYYEGIDLYKYKANYTREMDVIGV